MSKKISIGQISTDLCQNIYDRLEPYEQRHFMADNLGDASDDMIREEYNDRDLDNGEFDSYEDSDPEHMTNEQLFENLQKTLHAYNHTSYKMSMSLDDALATVRSMYSFNNVH